MSKGSPFVAIRVPADLLAALDASVESCNHSRTEEPYDRSAWIRVAIRERLAKLARGRKPQRKRKARARVNGTTGD